MFVVVNKFCGAAAPGDRGFTADYRMSRYG